MTASPLQLTYHLRAFETQVTAQPPELTRPSCVDPMEFFQSMPVKGGDAGCRKPLIPARRICVPTFN
jgi:hypothetical protein